MTFRFSRQGLQGRERVLQRAFEMLPGATSWTMLIGMTVLACWQPLLAAMLIIAFDLYWLLRLFYMTLFLVLSYLRLSTERQTDWMARLRDVDRLQAIAVTPGTLGQRISHWVHHRTLKRLTQQQRPPPRSTEIYHVVLIPILTEVPEVLEPGIKHLAEQPMAADRVWLVLALEGRASREVQEGVRALATAYRRLFQEVLVIVHPNDRPGEARVKGANATYAAKTVATRLRERAISFDRVIVSCFDADTVVSPQYLAALTYAFLVCPDRAQASFQPIPVYHNNIWEVPGFARVLDIGSSFFQLVEATDVEHLVTFSSHSMSFAALVEAGYWPVDLVSDDSAIFWKAFIHFDGRYRTVPIYVTLSMDVVVADSWWRTIVSVYRQKRRWAWGVENFAFVARAFVHASQIPWLRRVRYASKLFANHIAWATWPFLLGLIGWLPALFAAREFSDSVLYYSAPRITGIIFSLASLSLLVTIGLSLCLLPRRTVPRGLRTTIGHAVEWLLVPLISIALSALPALDAQTRLMLGRYLEFWSPRKPRLSNQPVAQRHGSLPHPRKARMMEALS